VFKLAWDRGSVCAPPAEPGEPAPYDGPLLDPVTAADHVLGPDDAAVTLIEYGDFECPYCGKTEPVLAELREIYGDRLRQVFRHYPLRQLHPHAIAAALVAESAADAGRFWEMHDVLFRNQLNLTDADLTRYAEELGINPWADVDRHRERIEADLAGGQRNGVRGTPSFFVNGIRHHGSHDLKSFRAAIDAELDRLGVSP